MIVGNIRELRTVELGNDKLHKMPEVRFTHVDT